VGADLRETELRDNVWVWTLGGDRIESSYGANCTAVAGREAVLLVDPLIAPAHARLVEAALRTKTRLPVRFVVLTHHHTDHALGAGWFAGKGTTIVAHRACQEAMAVEHPKLIEARRRVPALAELFADARPCRPSLDFQDEVLTFDLGGCVARIFHPGPGHTAGDAVVYFEGESVAVCGDLVSAGYHVNYEDAALANLEKGLEVLRGLGARSYVPGHGVAGGAELLDDQLLYHRAVAEAAKADDPAEARERLLSRFREHLLEEVLAASLPRWREEA
jgi:glyoxylase-like metal-dependent hydrolase (beta-lactamase superfamily II)